MSMSTFASIFDALEGDFGEAKDQSDICTTLCMMMIACIRSCIASPESACDC
jgi:hypothetical protein